MTGYESVDILLVENSRGDSSLTREPFEGDCIENPIHVVEDGDEALEFLHQRGEFADAPRPAVVLLDLDSSRKNGDEVLAEITGDPVVRTIPVIVVTNSKRHQDALKSDGPCANAYLTKPVDPVEFIETIRTFEDLWFSIVRIPDGEQ
ncbi:response regulator [Natrinema salaciae]|nr:response regulator [Natrinema salaciae]